MQYRQIDIEKGDRSRATNDNEEGRGRAKAPLRMDSGISFKMSEKKIIAW